MCSQLFVIVAIFFQIAFAVTLFDACMSPSALNSSIKVTDTEAKDTVQCLGSDLEQSLSGENMFRCIVISPTEGERGGGILFLVWISSALA